MVGESYDLQLPEIALPQRLCVCCSASLRETSSTSGCFLAESQRCRRKDAEDELT